MEDKDNAGAADQQNGEGSAGQNQEQAPTAEEIAELRKKADAFEDQKKRAEIAEGELKKYKPAPKQEQKPAEQEASGSSTSNSEDVTRARLEARGILDEDEQDEVMRAAKLLGVSPIKALDDDIVKGKLKAMRDQKATKEATPAPGSRGGGTTDNIGRLADKAFETGELPRDPALRQKVREEMKRRK
jgi:hypothetical protein